MARLIRDSSPPEATLARALSGWPGLALTRNSTCSSPCGCGSSLLPACSSMAEAPARHAQGLHLGLHRLGQVAGGLLAQVRSVHSALSR